MVMSKYSDEKNGLVEMILILYPAPSVKNNGNDTLKFMVSVAIVSCKTGAAKEPFSLETWRTKLLLGLNNPFTAKSTCNESPTQKMESLTKRSHLCHPRF